MPSIFTLESEHSHCRQQFPSSLSSASVPTHSISSESILKQLQRFDQHAFYRSPNPTAITSGTIQMLTKHHQASPTVLPEREKMQLDKAEDEKEETEAMEKKEDQEETI